MSFSLGSGRLLDVMGTVVVHETAPRQWLGGEQVLGKGVEAHDDHAVVATSRL
jgi:hypothetical protein